MAWHPPTLASMVWPGEWHLDLGGCARGWWCCGAKPVTWSFGVSLCFTWTVTVEETHTSSKHWHRLTDFTSSCHVVHSALRFQQFNRGRPFTTEATISSTWGNHMIAVLAVRTGSWDGPMRYLESNWGSHHNHNHNHHHHHHHHPSESTEPTDNLCLASWIRFTAEIEASDDAWLPLPPRHLLTIWHQNQTKSTGMTILWDVFSEHLYETNIWCRFDHFCSFICTQPVLGLQVENHFFSIHWARFWFHQENYFILFQGRQCRPAL